MTRWPTRSPPNPEPHVSSASTVRVGVEPDPAHVRVVRLVTVSLARLTGLPEETLDDVRLATSEAVGRAVAAHRTAQLDDLVEIEVNIGKVLEVCVRDRVPLPQAVGAAAVALLQGAAEAALLVQRPLADPSGDTLELDLPSEAELEPAVLPEAVSLIEGLVDESAVETGAGGTTVTMRWRRAG